eukprot:11187004-Lingulodinium_polyedra.AAC.1
MPGIETREPNLFNIHKTVRALAIMCMTMRKQSGMRTKPMTAAIAQWHSLREQSAHFCNGLVGQS